MQALKEIRQTRIHRFQKNVGSNQSKNVGIKRPDQPVFTDLVSSLLASDNNINAGLQLPSLSPDWLSVAIGMVLSVGNKATGRDPIVSPSNTSALLDAITTFLDDWSNTTSAGVIDSRSTRINFSLANDDINDVSHRCIFILEQILIPLLPCQIVVKKIYSCTSCQSTFSVYDTVTSIPVNVLRTGLHLEHDLQAFFHQIHPTYVVHRAINLQFVILKCFSGHKCSSCM